MSELKRAKMVGWYDPRQLVRTGYEVAISTIFGKYGDKRSMQAIADNGALRKRFYYEIFGEDGSDFWLDYISDLGDGFDSTYSVAYHATRDLLGVKTDIGGQTFTTRRGVVTVFGGDEVYPTASWAEYHDRLKPPYETAFNTKSDQPPALFAIPGNHDWYDSLIAFSGTFCRSRRFAGWKTWQNRSYFALKLPRGWWLFGTDMQLASTLDDAQMDYFDTVVKNHVGESDRIILCNAEPHWITRAMYPDDPAFNNRNLGYFEGHILDHRVAIHVAGDRHYYRRHEEFINNGVAVDEKSKSKVQKFVAGGGGAFLHPTHNEGVDEIGIRHRYKLKKTFPEESTSRRLSFWNLAFPLLNPYFGFVTGVLYLLTAQAFTADLSRYPAAEIGGAVASVAENIVNEPIATFWVTLIFAGFLLFTDTHSRSFRLIGGVTHAIAHLSSVFVLGWVSARGFSGLHPALGTLLSVLTVFGGGYIVGAFLMGIYLLISLNIFGVHHNEAFSSLRIADHKNFLRFCIAPSGDLTIFPIGIKSVSKKWKKGAAGEPQMVPEDLSAENLPFLIEEPISFEKGDGPAGDPLDEPSSASAGCTVLVIEREI